MVDRADTQSIFLSSRLSSGPRALFLNLQQVIYIFLNLLINLFEVGSGGKEIHSQLLVHSPNVQELGMRSGSPNVWQRFHILNDHLLPPRVCYQQKNILRSEAWI